MFATDCGGADTNTRLSALKDGQLLLLEKTPDSTNRKKKET
ncbi:MAG: hypothetical protein IPJ60_00025 [Sphingobacteriaceae bacterium]|nr:hypothetical protein [Sphingobacteriaceae bacterium]